VGVVFFLFFSVSVLAQPALPDPVGCPGRLVGEANPPWSLFDNGHLHFWHGVNSKERLVDFLSSGGEVAEGDVLLDPLGRAVMAHPPQRTSDLIFERWLDTLILWQKRIKIDLKDPAVIPIVIRELKKRKIDTGRVIVHATIMKGPNAGDPIFTVENLITVRKAFPNLLISLGVTTSKDSPPIGERHLADYMDAADRIGGPITFSIRGTHTTPAIREALSDLSKGWNITYWNDSANLVGSTLFDILYRTTPHAIIDLWHNGVAVRSEDPIDDSTKRQISQNSIAVEELIELIRSAPTPGQLIHRGTFPGVFTDLDNSIWKSNGLAGAVVGTAIERNLLTSVPREKMDGVLRRLGLTPVYLDRKDRGVGHDFKRAWEAFLKWKEGRPQDEILPMTLEMEAMYGWIFAGIKKTEIETLIRELVDEHRLEERIFSGVPDIIRATHKKGFLFFVISTCPQFILEPFVEKMFGIPRQLVRGTEVEIDEMGMIGLKVNLVTYGQGKQRALEALIREQRFQFSAKGPLLSRGFVVIGDSPDGGDSHLIRSGEIAIVPEPSSMKVVEAFDRLREEKMKVYFLQYPDRIVSYMGRD